MWRGPSPFRDPCVIGASRWGSSFHLRAARRRATFEASPCSELPAGSRRGGVHTPTAAFITLSACGETLPRFENRVSLHPTKTDRWGIPIPVIECAWSENETRMVADMRRVLTELLEATGGKLVSVSEPGKPGQVVHEMGTARMGLDP